MDEHKEKIITSKKDLTLIIETGDPKYERKLVDIILHTEDVVKRINKILFQVGLEFAEVEDSTNPNTLKYELKNV